VAALAPPQIPDWEPPADVHEARRSWEAHVARWLNTDLPEIGALHEDVALGANLTADIMVPKGPPPFPVVLYLHGGGWAFGSARSVRKVGMTFAANGIVAVLLNYRLAPEHPFPAALDDISTTIQWLGIHASAYGGETERLAIGGDSSGANLALAAAIRGPDDLRQRLSALLLLYGVYDLAGALERAHHHPGLVAQVRNYIGERPISDPLVSPLFARFPSLPPCFLLEGGADAFVSGEAAALAKALAAAGVGHALRIVPDMPHAFLQRFDLDGCTTGWRAMFDFLSASGGTARTPTAGSRSRSSR
jgi:acetyl esterase